MCRIKSEMTPTPAEAPTRTTRIRLTLDVSYTLNGASAQEMESNLSRMVDRAMGEGMITGHSDAEVVEHDITVKLVPETVTEESITEFMHQRIANGDLEAMDVPNQLARYGLMDPVDFTNEMVERMRAD